MEHRQTARPAQSTNYPHRDTDSALTLIMPIGRGLVILPLVFYFCKEEVSLPDLSMPGQFRKFLTVLQIRQAVYISPN